MWRSGKYYLEEKDYKWYDKLVLGIFDTLVILTQPINRWSNSRDRKVKVHVDNYDVWGADHTLGMIIAPTLKKLKEIKQGYPHVDNEDVPEELRFTLSEKEKREWDGTVDAKHEARWEWVLDEMIWAFEQHADPNDGEDQYHHNEDQLAVVFTPLEEDPKLSSLTMNYQKDPSKPAYWVDEEGKKKHYQRKANGVRLFGKYYCSLWD
jgi:hypothetical protein